MINTEEKTIENSKIQYYIDVLNDLNGKNKLSYNSLVKDLLETFGLKITIKQIEELYEPSIEELETDLEIQYRNVCT